MIDPITFKRRWEAYGDQVIPLDADTLASLELNPKTANFLSTSGLPEDAAPYLSFTGDMYGRKITDLFDDLDDDLARYITLGFDGAGNPIAIDKERDDLIVWLDHEADFRPTFMNTSIAALAAYLLGIKDLVMLTLSTRGDDAVLDQDFDQEHVEEFMKKLYAIDPKALDAGNFWKVELHMFLGVENLNR